jgi:hypothetical protein
VKESLDVFQEPRTSAFTGDDNRSRGKIGWEHGFLGLSVCYKPKTDDDAFPKNPNDSKKNQTFKDHMFQQGIVSFVGF